MSKISDVFLKVKNSRTIHQFLKYMVTGFTAFGIEYGLYVVLIRSFGVHYVPASAIVYALVFWFVFILNRKWSFGSTGSFKKQLVQYVFLFAFNLVVANIYLMAFLTETLGISQYLSPMIKMACVVSWNFIVYKYIIYT